MIKINGNIICLIFSCGGSDANAGEMVWLVDLILCVCFQWQRGKEPACQCRGHETWGRSPGAENGNPLQNSAWNPMDRGAWWVMSLGSHRGGHDWARALTCFQWAFQVAQWVKNLLAVQEMQEPWIRSPGQGDPGRRACDSLQYSCPENPMDSGAWRATVHGITQSQTRLKRPSRHTRLLSVSLLGSLYHGSRFQIQRICLSNFLLM